MRSSGRFRRKIIETHVPSGRLAFWWLGQHSWVVKTTNYTLAMDLYLNEDVRRLVPPALKPQDCDFFDLLLCTHEHSDHFDGPALAAIAELDTSTRFVVPKAVRDQANTIGLGDDRLILLDGDNNHEQENLQIISIPAAHEFLEHSSKTGFRYLGYIVNVDGFSIYHSGDTCYYEGLMPRLKCCPLDLMLIPINGRDGKRYRTGCIGNLTYQEAVDLAGEVNPRLVCPAHYGMFAYNTEDPQLFVDYLTAKYPSQKHWVGKPHQCVWYEKNPP